MTDGDDAGGSYRGLFGAFPYAFRRSDSLLFRSYAVVGGVAALLLTVLFALALVTLFGATAGARFSVARAFFFLVGLAAVGPTVTPVLLVARSHRRGISRRDGYDAALAAAGYLFLASLYLGAVTAAPPSLRSPATGPVVAALYDLPSIAALAFPVTGSALIWAAHRLRR
ncbi:hypothetical protein [Halobaculum sp. D14]|uniref:hypothetical protein n=1 Tax=Halobaculum sp. D14 TaxID=3421642 RepID=UPI003EB6D253